MLQLKYGSYVRNNHLLKMEYSFTDYGIAANIDAALLLEICLRFLDINRNENLYFLIETADGLKRELDTSSDDSIRNSVFSFRTGFDSFEKASGVLFFFSDLLTKDGLCRFSFGCDNKNDEIQCGKYNTVKIRCDNKDKYVEIFEKLKIPYTDKLVTAYDTFTMDSPGISKKATHKGMSVTDIPEALKMYGLI